MIDTVAGHRVVQGRQDVAVPAPRDAATVRRTFSAICDPDVEIAGSASTN
jgi:hypothetical protein